MQEAVTLRLSSTFPLPLTEGVEIVTSASPGRSPSLGHDRESAVIPDLISSRHLTQSLANSR
ncbi:unnamed protein product [Nesidiocoris tenuis]|uniref:Uncharacterized protein n=1 Tax=Nesidiocoris tenuis TaxID=355587 RepID=A0A6H5GB85_9HEMI|nr:unnamed protein product [Nesidiocoris tenuis]